MRQRWLALWEYEGKQLSVGFTSLDHETIARLSFHLTLAARDLSIPDEFEIQRIGEPFDDRKRPYEPGMT